VKFIFLSNPTFEYWSWRSPDDPGIGGSETSHVEMCRRIAERGHEVLSFAPVPEESHDPAGVPWRWIEDCDYSQHADVWIIYRAPELVDNLPLGTNAWLICQDIDYRGSLTLERQRKFSRIVALCEAQSQHLKALHPESASKIVVSSNGIKSELIAELIQYRIDHSPDSGFERNPHRLMYASSPDRGLLNLLDVFPRAKENVPDLELHVFYGFDNINKVIESGKDSGNHAGRVKDAVIKAMDQPGVFHHGRMGQRELLKEWLKSGIWCHVSAFPETSCITCMDAQACGAIPITNPIWAVRDNVQHGVFISGDVTQSLVKAYYTLELIKLAKDPERQEEIRREMMPWALEAFNWELWVDQWLGWARADVAVRSFGPEPTFALPPISRAEAEAVLADNEGVPE
jgi:glycosyltransferase involved in cell wall biosynthesis